MKPRNRVPEVAIGRAVVSWLEADSWDVWQEVGCGTASSVCDIVAKRGPVIHAIECKAVANLDVLEQAQWWVGRANFVSVAVPLRRKSVLYSTLAKSIGIGVLWVGEEWRERSTALSVLSWDQGRMARVLDHRYYAPLRDYLTPERKAWPAEAGNNLGHRYTPFRETCDHLRAVVKAQPGITMKAAVACIASHHYRTDKAATAALMQWVRLHRIKGVRADAIEGSRALGLFPDAQQSQ